MDKPKAFRMRICRPTTRRLIQLYSALLHNAYLKGFISGEIYKGNAKYACLPGLNCYSCPGAAASCPLGALQNALASTGHRAGWYIFGMLLLFGVVLGRTVCGWLCPFGLLQELLHKIPTPKLRKSRFTRMLSCLKFVILAVFVIAVPLWFGLKTDLPLPAFCKYICPAGTFEGAVGHLVNPSNAGMFQMLGALFTQKWLILLVVLLVCVFCYRGFCRFLCPLGAIYGFFCRCHLIGVRVDENRCSGCGACVRCCGMDIRHVGDHECIHCGKCMKVCGQGAISLKAGEITLKSPGIRQAGMQPDKSLKKTSRRMLWAVALAVLCFAVLWFNFLDPSLNKTDSSGQIAEASAAVGEFLPDFSVPCYDHSVFRLEDTRGKIVFINLWATYCTPCKGELPYFNDLALRHQGDIAVLAVHPSLVTDDPESYLSDKEYIIRFATDSQNTVAGLIGATGVLPQTVVLDREGKIVWNAVGSVTPEMLSALYDLADQSSAGKSVPSLSFLSGKTGKAEASETYTVFITDPEGNPLSGVSLGFCTDTVCQIVDSDENGKAVFRGEPYQYHLQILRVPEGFSTDLPEELVTDEHSCVLTLTLLKSVP